jgi:hypothetical protein
MEPGLYNINIYRGADLRQHVEVSDDKGNRDDFTGYDAVLRIHGKSGDTILELTTENGGITFGQEKGTFDLYISKAQTSLLDPVLGPLEYWLDLLAPNGDELPLLFGRILVMR